MCPADGCRDPASETRSATADCVGRDTASVSPDSADSSAQGLAERSPRRASPGGGGYRHSLWTLSRQPPCWPVYISLPAARRDDRALRGCCSSAVAGIAAGMINAVVGSGSLFTFPTLLALGVPAHRRERLQQHRPRPRERRPRSWGYRRELAGQRRRTTDGWCRRRSVAGAVVGADRCCSRCPPSAFADDRPGAHRGRGGARASPSPALQASAEAAHVGRPPGRDTGDGAAADAPVRLAADARVSPAAASAGCSSPGSTAGISGQRRVSC